MKLYARSRLMMAGPLAGFLLAAAPCFAATLFRDGFSTSGTLAGHLPDTTGTTTWGGNTGFISNGSVINYAPGGTFGAGMASIDLGSGYFTANPGIYELSLRINYAANASPSTGVWGVGFSTGTSATNANSLASGGGGVLGQPWVFLRENGEAAFRNNSNSTNIATTTVTAVGNSHVLMIRLDTTTALWTFSVFMDGNQFGTTQTYTSNPALRYIAITSTTLQGTADDFLFTGPIPEPSLAILGGVSAICLAGRRKRHR